MTAHAYPRDLAEFVVDLWDEVGFDTAGGIQVHEPLPELSVLEHWISTCYQASLLREEERPVTFRSIACPPMCLPEEAGPPTGLHRLTFTQPRPMVENELRRLSPSADYYRSLIGIRFGEGRVPEIWGILSSGPRWILAAQGDRTSSASLPDCPVVSATAPGRIVVARGSATVATLHGGRIIRPETDVLESGWLQDTFASVRQEILDAYRQRAALESAPRRAIDPRLVGRIGRHVVRRLISIVRSARHGATLLLLPSEAAERCEHESYLNIKYGFADDAPRRRFRELILRIIDVLGGLDGTAQQGGPVGWEEYLASDDARLIQLDEAVAEFAHLMAGLSAVDGALVLTRRFEMLGFGAEIAGNLPNVHEVDRALDADARRTSPESTAGVGTRHRSVYRLCQGVPEVLAIVISQDGGVRFVKQLDGRVAYWDQVAAGIRE
jgi:hypothetical protein